MKMSIAKGSPIQTMGKLGSVRKPRAKSQPAAPKVTSAKVRKPRSFGTQIKNGIYRQQP